MAIQQTRAIVQTQEMTSDRSDVKLIHRTDVATATLQGFQQDKIENNNNNNKPAVTMCSLAVT